MSPDHHFIAITAGRHSSGPIAAFLRPLPPAQPEAEAKAMAASLAATAAAHAKQQEYAVHAVAHVCLKPDPDVDEARAMPELQQHYLSCPAKMQVGQLQEVKICLSASVRARAEAGFLWHCR